MQQSCPADYQPDQFKQRPCTRLFSIQFMDYFLQIQLFYQITVIKTCKAAPVPDLLPGMNKKF